MKEMESLNQSKEYFLSVLKNCFENQSVTFEDVCYEAKGLVLGNTDKLDDWESSDKEFFDMVFGLEGTTNLFDKEDEKSKQAIKNAEERVREYYEKTHKK